MVITIVVLIILAAVAIQLSLGDNGIFSRAKTAKEQYKNAQDYEETEVGKVTNQIDLFTSRDSVITEEKLNQLLYPNKSMTLTNTITGFSDAISAQNYTIPKTGWIYIKSARNAAGGWFQLTLNSMMVFQQNSGVASNGASSYFPVKEGDILTKTQSHTGFYFDLVLNYYE